MKYSAVSSSRVRSVLICREGGFCLELVGAEPDEGGLVVEKLYEIGMPGDDLAQATARAEEQAEPARHLG